MNARATAMYTNTVQSFYRDILYKDIKIETTFEPSI